MTEASHHLGNDSSSFHPVHSLIRADGHLDLHHPKGRGPGAVYLLPDKAQSGVEDHYVVPDFTYSDDWGLVFVDGPHHKQPLQKQLDARKRKELDEAGCTRSSEVGAFYWTDMAPDIVNPGQEEQGSVSV
jgi:hypothetical protein